MQSFEKRSLYPSNTPQNPKRHKQWGKSWRKKCSLSEYKSDHCLLNLKIEKYERRIVLTCWWQDSVWSCPPGTRPSPQEGSSSGRPSQCRRSLPTSKAQCCLRCGWIPAKTIYLGSGEHQLSLHLDIVFPVGVVLVSLPGCNEGEVGTRVHRDAVHVHLPEGFV